MYLSLSHPELLYFQISLPLETTLFKAFIPLIILLLPMIYSGHWFSVFLHPHHSSCPTYSYTLKKKAARSSKISVNMFQATWRHNPEDCDLQNLTGMTHFNHSQIIILRCLS
jgi:hypothetical protein